MIDYKHPEVITLTIVSYRVLDRLPSCHLAMVILVTDDDVYYELKCPGVTTIGRGSSNNVVPESRSISKSHAILTLNMSSHGRLDMFLEDLNSTNGTYLGSSPLEIHRINGKESISFGDYLRFGHSSQYYRVQKCMPPGTGTLSVPLDRSDSPLNMDESVNNIQDLSNGDMQKEDMHGHPSEIRRNKESDKKSREDREPCQNSELLSYYFDLIQNQNNNQNRNLNQNKNQNQPRLSKSTPILSEESFHVEKINREEYGQKLMKCPSLVPFSISSNKRLDKKFNRQIILRDRGINRGDDENENENENENGDKNENENENEIKIDVEIENEGENESKIPNGNEVIQTNENSVENKEYEEIVEMIVRKKNKDEDSKYNSRSLLKKNSDRKNNIRKKENSSSFSFRSQEKDFSLEGEIISVFILNYIILFCYFIIITDG